MPDGALYGLRTHRGSFYVCYTGGLIDSSWPCNGVHVTGDIVAQRCVLSTTKISDYYATWCAERQTDIETRHQDSRQYTTTSHDYVPAEQRKDLTLK